MWSFLYPWILLHQNLKNLTSALEDPSKDNNPVDFFQMRKPFFIWECVESKNVQNKQQFRKVWKHCKSYIHCVRHVGNDDLNYVCTGWHDAHHRSRYFEKVKMCTTNWNFEKVENTLNLIYTVCAMSEMMTWTMFAMVSMMRIPGVDSSKKSKCAEQTGISKRLKTL